MPTTKLRRFFRHGLLPQLLVFAAVARVGSVTRAAAALHLAQPTVSLQLKKLAGNLELTLFEQRGRTLHLTPAGRALRAACEDLVVFFSELEERLAPFRAEMAALFLREALLYNGAGKEEGNGDSARLQRGGRPDRP